MNIYGTVRALLFVVLGVFLSYIGINALEGLEFWVIMGCALAIQIFSQLELIHNEK